MSARRRRFATALAAVAIAVTSVGPGSSDALAAIDQAPILRVVRSNDVPGSENLLLPSGALTLGQLVSADTGAGPVRSAERAALSAGFRSAAISAFAGPGKRLLRSFAVEFGSPGQAAQALELQRGVLMRVAVPAGAVAAGESVESLPDGLAVTYSRSPKAAPRELVVLARSGSWLFALRGSGDTGGTSRSFLAGLLGRVIDRH